jgi:hypothetical protein
VNRFVDEGCGLDGGRLDSMAAADASNTEVIVRAIMAV